MSQAVSARQQQFERIIETGSVRLSMRDHRPHFVQIRPQQLGLHCPAAGVHPVHIAANRVDFAIMRHQPERMGQPPAGESVGREALVNQPERRLALWIAQIVVERANLIGQQQSLVHDCARGKAGHIGVCNAGQLEVLSLLLERVERLFANHDQLALESVLIGAILAASDDRLLDYGHRIDNGRAQSVQGDGYIAPTDQLLAFFGGKFFELFGDICTGGLVLRHEAHGHTIFARLRKLFALILRPLAQQRVRNLQENSGAITQQRVGSNCTAVINILQNLQRLRNDFVRSFTLNMRDKTDTAGVMFVFRVIQALGRWKSHSKIHSCQMPTLRRRSGPVGKA